MEPFIHPLSVILYSKVPVPPTPEEVIGLTSDSIWSWFIYCLGWHEPALPEKIRRLIRRHFESLPFRLRRLLIRPDLLPHRHYQPDMFRSDEPVILALYRLTAAIRALSVRRIHRLSYNQSYNRVDKYAVEHQLWVPEAELNWLRMRSGMREEAEGKCIDFPIALKFTVCQPQNALHPGRKCEIRTMTLHGVPGDGYWPVEFFKGSRVDNENGQASISFSRNVIARALGIDLPQSLEKLGYSWVENLTWGPENRVLFRKVCSDEHIGILLWPSLPDESQLTPRIPVYKKDIIELVDGDRLLIFVGPKRGLEDVVIMITVTAQWASFQDPERTYADTKYVYPNPCERYPHCVRRPIYKPIISPEPVNEEDRFTPKSDYTSFQTEEDDTWDTEITVEVLDEDHESGVGGDVNKAIKSSSGEEVNKPSDLSALKVAASMETARSVSCSKSTTTKRKRQSTSTSPNSSISAKQARH